MDVESPSLVERLRMIVGTQFTPIETALVLEAAEALSRQKAAGEAMKEALHRLGVSHNMFVEQIGPEPGEDRLYPWIGRLGEAGVQSALEAANHARDTLTAWNSIEQGDGG